MSSHKGIYPVFILETGTLQAVGGDVSWQVQIGAA